MAKEKNLDGVHPATILVRSGQIRSQFDETSEALYLTSGYVYESCQEAEAGFKGEKQRYLYGRYANPTNSMLEKRLADLENAKFCAAVSSGMAAVSSALVSTLCPGDRIVSARSLFGNCFWIINDLLPRLGVEVVWVDGDNPQDWEKALATKTKMVFFETPSNPSMQIVDIEHVCKLAKKIGAITVVDNVFSTPIGQHPLALGADVVVYSATKHMDGQGRCLAGAVLSNDEIWWNDVFFPYVRNAGPSLSPFNAWVILKGLETMILRVEKQSQNALELAKFLENHPAIESVAYPGLESHPQYALAQKQMFNNGTLLGVRVKGDKHTTFDVVNRLNIVDISNNLGDTKTLCSHPGTTTHSRMTEQERLASGITENFIRISVGLEDIRDIIADFKQALGA